MSRPVHIKGFKLDKDGRRVVRDEKKYDGLEALRAAIARDADEARDYFRDHG